MGLLKPTAQLGNTYGRCRNSSLAWAGELETQPGWTGGTAYLKSAITLMPTSVFPLWFQLRKPTQHCILWGVILKAFSKRE